MNRAKKIITTHPLFLTARKTARKLIALLTLAVFLFTSCFFQSPGMAAAISESFLGLDQIAADSLPIQIPEALGKVVEQTYSISHN
jgi:hypothetical protein